MHVCATVLGWSPAGRRGREEGGGEGMVCVCTLIGSYTCAKESAELKSQSLLVVARHNCTINARIV